MRYSRTRGRGTPGRILLRGALLAALVVLVGIGTVSAQAWPTETPDPAGDPGWSASLSPDGPGAPRTSCEGSTDSLGSAATGDSPTHPNISIKTYTNGHDADTPPGPSIGWGDAVSWTYVVTNVGDVTLTDIQVLDSRGEAQIYLPTTTLAPGEAMTAWASSVACVGQYANIGTATGRPPTGDPVNASDPSHYFGVLPPPSVSFIADPPSGPAPLTVRFTDTSSGDFITQRAWTFGDGASSTDQHPTHTYAEPGTYTVNLTVANLGAGSASAVQNVTVMVPPQQVPGGAGGPTDTDGDGLYEDVNGNGRKDFADVVLYFNQMTWIAGNEPVAAFDCNANGRIDFADVVWLFNHL
ncbi:MAG: PKD domain-containing protein [Methanospirillum sp.]